MRVAVELQTLTASVLHFFPLQQYFTLVLSVEVFFSFQDGGGSC